MSDPRISIIVLNMNGLPILRECLQSIEKIDYPNLELIVVDNASADGSQEMVRKTFPRVRLIENRVNLGVAEAQNAGIRCSLLGGADFVLLLNNDITVDSGVLRHFIRYFDAGGETGIASPMIYDSGNSTTVQSAGGIIDWYRGGVHHLASGQLDHGVSEILEIDFTGVPLVRSELFRKVGLFDPEYFAYWEDVDFCTRVKEAGFKIVTVASAKVWHKGSYTTRKLSGFKSYYSTRNRFRFMKSHATRAQCAIFLLRFVTFELWREMLTYMASPQEGGSLIAFFRGIIDGVMPVRR